MSRYPEIRAGQRITGQLLTGIQFEEVVKQAATIRSGTGASTYANDPDLQFTLEANATYHVEFWLQYACGAGLLKTEWTVPAGASGLKRRGGISSDQIAGSAESDAQKISWGVHGFGTDLIYGQRSGSSQTFGWETGIVTTSAGGTLALAWAQNVDNAAATEISAFSYARLKRVA
jgi:hypothetical protein